MLSSINQGSPGPGPALELFEAIGRKAWAEVEALVAPGIAVEVHAGPGIHTRRNEHVWRAVSLRGMVALRRYLAEIHQAMPALNVQARVGARAVVLDHEVIRTDCAGVDSAGSFFDAETDFAVWARDGVLQRVEAQVNGIAVGTEVIRQTGGDPRRYFRNFLDDPGV